MLGRGLGLQLVGVELAGAGERDDAVVGAARPRRERIVDRDPAVQGDRVGRRRAGLLAGLGEVEPRLGAARAVRPALQVAVVVRGDRRPVAGVAQQVADQHLGVGADDRVGRDRRGERARDLGLVREVRRARGVVADEVGEQRQVVVGVAQVLGRGGPVGELLGAQADHQVEPRPVIVVGRRGGEDRLERGPGRLPLLQRELLRGEPLGGGRPVRRGHRLGERGRRGRGARVDRPRAARRRIAGIGGLRRGRCAARDGALPVRVVTRAPGERGGERGDERRDERRDEQRDERRDEDAGQWPHGTTVATPIPQDKFRVGERSWPMPARSAKRRQARAVIHAAIASSIAPRGPNPAAIVRASSHRLRIRAAAIAASSVSSPSSRSSACWNAIPIAMP